MTWSAWRGSSTSRCGRNWTTCAKGATERIARNRAGDPTVHIPRVFWETTTARVLTQERIVGLKVTDVAALDAAGIDRAALATRAARLVLTMVFEDGFFHADLHPGNLFIEEGGRIGLIDFGMVGMVDTRTRETLGLLLLAVTRQDAVGVADTLMRWARRSSRCT